MNITIKSIPADVGAALKHEAAQPHRSLNGEIIHRLSRSLTAESSPIPVNPDAVADAWTALTGRWKSDHNVEAEISEFYATRSAGRDADTSDRAYPATSRVTVARTA